MRVCLCAHTCVRACVCVCVCTRVRFTVSTLAFGIRARHPAAVHADSAPERRDAGAQCLVPLQWGHFFPAYSFSGCSRCRKIGRGPFAASQRRGRSISVRTAVGRASRPLAQGKHNFPESFSTRPGKMQMESFRPIHSGMVICHFHLSPGVFISRPAEVEQQFA